MLLQRHSNGDEHRRGGLPRKIEVRSPQRCQNEDTWASRGVRPLQRSIQAHSGCCKVQRIICCCPLGGEWGEVFFQLTMHAHCRSQLNKVDGWSHTVKSCRIHAGAQPVICDLCREPATSPPPELSGCLKMTLCSSTRTSLKLCRKSAGTCSV